MQSLQCDLAGNMNSAEPGVGMRIRLVPAEEIDPAVVAEVANAAFSVHELVAGPRTSPEGVLDEAGDGSDFLFVEEAANLLGLAMVAPAHAEHLGFTPRVLAGLQGKGIPAFGDLYFGMASVVPEAQGKGLGRLLVEGAERYARVSGFGRVVLTTVRELGNVTYYERLGFAVADSEWFEPGHYSIPVRHEVCLMVKSL